MLALVELWELDTPAIFYHSSLYPLLDEPWDLAGYRAAHNNPCPITCLNYHEHVGQGIRVYIEGRSK